MSGVLILPSMFGKMQENFACVAGRCVGVLSSRIPSQHFIKQSKFSIHKVRCENTPRLNSVFTRCGRLTPSRLFCPLILEVFVLAAICLNCAAWFSWAQFSTRQVSTVYSIYKYHSCCDTKSSSSINCRASRASANWPNKHIIQPKIAQPKITISDTTVTAVGTVVTEITFSA